MKQYSRHLLFCKDSDCKGKKLAKEARKLLGKDAKHVKRSTVKCLGACKHGPVMCVYPDGVWYGDVNKKVLQQVIAEHIQGGKPVKKQIIQQMQPQEKET